MAKTKTRRSREIPIMFYVAQQEKEQIVEAAELRDMSISEFCRQTLLHTACKKEVSDV